MPVYAVGLNAATFNLSLIVASDALTRLITNLPSTFAASTLVILAALIALAAPVAPPIGNVTAKPLIKIVSLAVKLQSTVPVSIPYFPPPLVNL